VLLTLSPRRILTVCLTFAVCLLAVGPVRAEDGVKVTVVAILASGEEPPRVDPKLQHIAKEIQKNHPQLKTFLLKRTTCMGLKLGQKESYPLVEEQVVEVTVLDKKGKDGKVRLQVKAPRLAEITYRCCCDKFFPIMTGYVTKKQERLIVAVMVPPCP
jgi:hypothetical protein